MIDDTSLVLVERLRDLPSRIDRWERNNPGRAFPIEPNDLRDLLERLRKAEGERDEARKPKQIATILAAIPEPWRTFIAGLQTKLTAAEAQAQSIQAENERLRAALEPFAALFDRFGSDCVAAKEWRAMRESTSINDFRNARLALSDLAPSDLEGV